VTGVFCVGKNCEYNFNECASNPCRNGARCRDGINEFTCQCEPGFTGMMIDGALWRMSQKTEIILIINPDWSHIV